MGPETSLFTLALGLQAPWSVTDVRFDAELKEIPEGMGLAANPLHQADTACPALKCMKVQDNIVLPSIRPPDHSWPLLP